MRTSQRITTGITVCTLTSLSITGASLTSSTISQRSARPTIQRLEKDVFRLASTHTPHSRDCIIPISTRRMSASISTEEGRTVKSLLYVPSFMKGKSLDTSHLATNFTSLTGFTSQSLITQWLRVSTSSCLSCPR